MLPTMILRRSSVLRLAGLPRQSNLSGAHVSLPGPSNLNGVSRAGTGDLSIGKPRTFFSFPDFFNNNTSIKKNIFKSETENKTIQYDLDKITGWGANGQVSEGQPIGEDETYMIVKTFTKNFSQEDREREVRVLEKGQHPRVMGITGVFRDTDNSIRAIALEPGSLSMEDIIKKKKYTVFRECHDKNFQENVVFTALKHALDGILHLHSQNIVHNDLDPRHVMLFPDGFKVIDVGAGKNTKNPVYGKEQSKVDDILTLASSFKGVIEHSYQGDESLTKVIDFLTEIPKCADGNKKDEEAFHDKIKDLMSEVFESPSNTILTSEELNNFFKQDVEQGKATMTRQELIKERKEQLAFLRGME
jgi:serine/threonine protein kinase